MHKERHTALRMAAFIVIGIFLFLWIQDIFTPEWIYPRYEEGPADTFTEFYELPTETNIQAVFVGASHSMMGVDPMRIYLNSGIATYDMSTPSQPVELGYYLTKEVFRVKKDHAPKYVLLDVAAMRTVKPADYKKTTFRYSLENMQFSSNLIDAAKYYASQFGEEKQTECFLSIFSPIIMYHSRWNELTKGDFEKIEPRSQYRKGFFRVTIVAGTTATTDEINSIAENLHTEDGKTYTVSNDGKKENIHHDILYNPVIPSENITYLLKIKEICEENGAELVLIKVPTIGFPQISDGWTRLWHDQMSKLAQENGIRFFDMLYDVEVGMDWTNDTEDGGSHLNYSGAKKVSDCLSSYLQNELGLTGEICEAYEEDIPLYTSLCCVSDLQTTKELPSYLDQLSRMPNVAVFFSCYSEMMAGMQEEHKEALRNFGLQTDFNEVQFRDSFLAIVENGQVLYESYGNRRISKSGTLSNGKPYTVVSSGWLSNPDSTIIIDGTNHSRGASGGNGLNIVVYDMVSGCVLDSVTFQTGSPQSQPGIHSGSLEGYLRKYEQYLMIQYAKEQ